MLAQYLLVFLGGGLGCIVRFFIYQTSAPLSHQFPISTLMINLVGSFLIGFVFCIILEKFDRYVPFLRAAVMLGFLGGFTTFSAFSMETLTLLQQGDIFKAVSYILCSVIGCIFAAWLGVLLAHV